MITLITGGARSGKSSFAQNLAIQETAEPCYVATARDWGGDFTDRIRRHQHDRDSRWHNYEAEKWVSQLPLEGKTVVIDCITLWLTNFFTDNQQDIDRSLEDFKAEINQLAKMDAHLIIVTNELGMGLHADTEVGRKFTDLQGWANQYTASVAGQVIFMVSGLPLFLKSPAINAQL
ncbi:MAG: bifunctional adenosylcobinamide kinase/adenosylcobinamide-phosphate guanylyltransferase [Chitinophagaceae bacterium]|jgi:adenosylcobinamide kinase/adenosylcobinamide-phosphate guanylyltransferase|nr:bifunctional adenosylcobinamide kinase/adenosylcobinamide-phosphate guanylyltransferase [Chitinophagaceae bacterium]